MLSIMDGGALSDHLSAANNTYIVATVELAQQFNMYDFINQV